MTSFTYNFHYKPSGMTTNTKPAGPALYGIGEIKEESGIPGIAMYFFDSMNITGTKKEDILKRIDEGKTIDGTKNAVRQYSDGDLIICKVENGGQNNIYKIIKSENGEHEYDIIPWGRLEQPKQNQKDIEYFIDNSHINMNLVSEYTESKIPSNRSFDTSTNLFYTDGLGNTIDPNSPVRNIAVNYDDTSKELFGIGMTPTITFKDINIPKRFLFYLKITITQEKGLIGTNGFTLKKGHSNCYDGDDSNFTEEPMYENTNIVKFEKVLEIPLNCKTTDGSTFGVIHNMTYLSDISCDKLHPSGNNINVSFFDPKTTNGWQVNKKYKDLKWLKITYGKIDSGPQDYFINGRNFEYINEEERRAFFREEIEVPLMIGSYKDWHPMIQMSKRKREGKYDTDLEEYSGEHCIINFRSGESAYFSGMVPVSFPRDCFHVFSQKYVGSGPSNTYDAYVTMNRSINLYNNDFDESDRSHSAFVLRRKDFLQNYIYKEIFDFIFNEKNTFELVYAETESGITKYKKLNISDLNFNIVN